jgi:alpha-mannosidase
MVSDTTIRVNAGRPSNEVSYSNTLSQILEEKMTVSDPFFTLEKIRKYLDEDIFPARRRCTVPLERWKYVETSMEERLDDAFAPDYDESAWADFCVPGYWAAQSGGYDRVAWFRGSAAIPAGWEGRGVPALRVLAGPRDGGGSTAEALLYVNGAAVQGFDGWHEEALLSPELCATGRLNLALKAWSGVVNAPKQRRFAVAELLLIDPAADRFSFRADTLLKCALTLGEGDLRRIRLTQALNRAFGKIDFLNRNSDAFYTSLAVANALLDAEMEALARYDELKPSVAGVGHSHIDMAWLWRLNATREKAARTFATTLNLMRQYPSYRFMHSSPQLYQSLSEDYPAIFEQVREKIAAGQWEISGGMWIESDTNLTSGESLVRQFLFGTRYVRKTFGKEMLLVWLPDVFGYSAALPQIFRKSGMAYFMTTKISWNQYNHFPYDTFLWRGIDGSEILTHFITTPDAGSWFYTYNGHITPDEVSGIWKNYKDKDKNADLLLSYGWGDGGGGPTREMIESALTMENVPGVPCVRLEHAEPYFARLAETVKDAGLRVWEGEMYLEFHRGTYTSQARMKKDNRGAEILLHETEALCSLCAVASAPTGAKAAAYPQAELNKVWERVLLNQFHDILPGSSIRQVYEDTRADYEAIRAKLAGLREAAERALFAVAAPDSLMVYDTSGVRRSEAVFLPFGNGIDADTRLFDNETALPVQRADGGLWVWFRDAAPYGWKRFGLKRGPAAEPVASPLRVSASAIETPFYRISLNEAGEIASLYDKRLDREVAAGPLNRLMAFEDKPLRSDAWDIDIFYREKPYTAIALNECIVEESGPIRAVLRITRRFNQSTITQRLIVYAEDPRIEFQTHVDWREEQVVLKTFFPVTVHSTRAAYEIQFGNLERPAHTNTEYDFAQFEVCAQRWADLSEDGFGVALLNDCKYGHDIHNGVMSLTLLKCAPYPDESADKGEHDFSYALLPHAGGWREGGVQEAAIRFNQPIRVLTGVQPKGAVSDTFSLCVVESDHVLLDTIKRAEDEEAWILRLYEYKNRRDKAVNLRFGLPPRKVVETDLMENEIGGAELLETGIRGLRFPIGCYEIKTFKVWF